METDGVQFVMGTLIKKMVIFSVGSLDSLVPSV